MPAPQFPHPPIPADFDGVVNAKPVDQLKIVQAWEQLGRPAVEPGLVRARYLVTDAGAVTDIEIIETSSEGLSAVFARAKQNQLYTPAYLTRPYTSGEGQTVASGTQVYQTLTSELFWGSPSLPYPKGDYHWVCNRVSETCEWREKVGEGEDEPIPKGGPKGHEEGEEGGYEGEETGGSGWGSGIIPGPSLGGAKQPEKWWWIPFVFMGVVGVTALMMLDKE